MGEAVCGQRVADDLSAGIDSIGLADSATGKSPEVGERLRSGWRRLERGGQAGDDCQRCPGEHSDLTGSTGNREKRRWPGLLFMERLSGRRRRAASIGTSFDCSHDSRLPFHIGLRLSKYSALHSKKDSILTTMSGESSLRWKGRVMPDG
jgi:hypothetical protein